jgi:uncharacterized protein YecE (DUF72 family)
MEHRQSIHIGTSGWHYAHWQGPFYPQNLPKKKFLAHYAEHFQTVEINNSFYRLPAEKTLVEWREIVPQDFIFGVKASRFITHMKKLKDPKEPLETFLGRINALRDKLGPILFQLPPRWNFNFKRLQSFLEALPRGYRYAFEFRDSSWFNERTYKALKDYGVSFCIYDLAGEISPKEITSDMVYVRLHGPGDAYQGCYGTEQLACWAGAFYAWRQEGREIYCYFDNDEAGYAAENALRLKKMIEK